MLAGATGLRAWWHLFHGKRAVEKLSVRTIKDSRGSLSVFENVPFAIKRVYYLHGIEKDAMRGAHAHRETDRLIVAVNGSFKATLRTDKYYDFEMDDPTVALRVKPYEWLELSKFSKGAVALVLASTLHKDSDCISDFREYVRERNLRKREPK